MRIIMLINSYISGMSGGDTWAIEIAKRLAQIPSNQIKIVTTKRAAIEWKSKGIDTCDIITTTKESSPGNLLLLYLKRILTYLKRKPVMNTEDIVFATSIFLPDVIPLLFSKGKKVTIFHMQAPHPIYGYRHLLTGTKKIDLNIGNVLNWINEKISMTLLKLINVTIFVLPTTKKVVQKYGFSDHQIFLTTNGIDIEYIKKIPEQNKEFDACWVGRPHPQKGVDDLIDIWEKVVQKYPDKKLIIMGADTENYNHVIKRKDLENNIIIKGFVSDEEKLRIMKSCKLFLSTSYFESFHIALLEAISCGLIIYAYNLSVYRQIYGNLVHYVKLGDKKSFVKSLNVFFEKDVIDQFYQKQAKEFIQNFDWNIISKHVYNDLKNI